MVFMKLINRCTDFCVKNGIVADDDAAWFSYALERRICNCTAVLLLFPLGCWLSNWRVSLSFFLSFYFLRKRASGFHAKTFAGCFVFSTICAFTIFRFTAPLCSTTVQVVICAVSTALIFGLAPFDHPNMHMSSTELDASRKIARRNTVILDTAFLVANICNAYDFAVGISLALGYTALLLLLAYGTPNYLSRKENTINE